MKHLKMLGLTAMAAVVLMAVAGGSTASATTLEVKGVVQNGPVVIKTSLSAGTSALLKDSAGTTTDTCTETSGEGKTASPYTAVGKTAIGGPISSMKIGGCSHTTKNIAPGSLSISWVSGTDGTVTSSGAEVTTLSTAFGASAVCKTGTGTDIGLLTGKASGFATIDINGKLSCGILGTATWTSSYTVTSPEGLGVVE